MANPYSSNLIQFDDSLIEFDPLAQTTSANHKQAKNSSSFETYSKELLGYDVSTKDSGPGSKSHDGYLESSSRSFSVPANLPLKLPEQKPAGSTSTSSAFCDNNANNNEMFNSRSSSNLVNRSTSNSRTFTSYVSDSSKVQGHPKVQSKFYDSNTEAKGTKKTQGLFYSYVDDRPDRSNQKKSRFVVNIV